MSTEHALVFGKTQSTKTSGVHSCLTEFSKTDGEAKIFKKKKAVLFSLCIYSVKDNWPSFMDDQAILFLSGLELSNKLSCLPLLPS